jgi:putative lipase involved disintegration of autophagic bodies
LRGHVFATPDNSTIVIAIKGTSAGLLGNGGSTGVNDKLNVRMPDLYFICDHLQLTKTVPIPMVSNCRITYFSRVVVQESVGVGRQFVIVTRGRTNVERAVWRAR